MKQLVNRFLQRFGYQITRRNVAHGDFGDSAWSVPYLENPEVGAVNLTEKTARVARGEPFEWPNIVATNQAVASLLTDERCIAEIGGGTGCFAEAAATDSQRRIVCSDLDSDAIGWAQEHRSHPNIQYVSRAITPDDGPFDVVVAIEVIEHIMDYRAFLRNCVALAPLAIITTPNKNRNPRTARAAPPAYHQHVREWTAGEFYWVLRVFYNDVHLYAMPDPYQLNVIPIQVTSTLTPLIAVCRQPVGDAT